jgi:hypothetical protein
MARFIIDVSAIYWGISYLPIDWTHYALIYFANARLLDVQTNTLIAKGICQYIPYNATNASSYNEVFANQTVWLTSELSLAAKQCIRSLKSEIFAL